MADIELVIKIPEEAYKNLLEEQKLPNGLDLEYFIIHGRPLPKNLISRDFMKEMGATCIAKRIPTGELVAISSIDELTEELGKIEADKENKE